MKRIGLFLALVASTGACAELVRDNPCDVGAGEAFDLARCHEAQGLEPGSEGALCRTDADCAAHFECDNRECAFFNTAPIAKADERDHPEDLDDGAPLLIEVLENDSDDDGDTLTVVSVSQARNGIVTITEDERAVEYTPLLNTNGLDAFTYSVDDGNGATRTGTVTVNVTPVNDEPELRTLQVVVEEDATVTIQLQVDDPDGDVVTVSETLVTGPVNGIAVVANNALSYTPFPDFAHAAGETDTIVVSLSDGATTVDRTVNARVFPINDAPIAFVLGPGDFFLDEDGDTFVPLPFDASFSSDPDPDDVGALQFVWFVDGVDQGTALNDATPTLNLGVGRNIIDVFVFDPFGAAAAATTEVVINPSRLFVNANVAAESTAPDGGTRSGFTWDNATTSLSQALAQALQQAPNIKDIWVADGTYVTEDVSGFALVTNVAVLGGFNGGETSPDERNHLANETILTGDLAGNDEGFNADLRGDNAFHVVNAVDIGGQPILDGFTVRNGFARSGIPDGEKGAAIFIRNASPSLLRLKIVANVCDGIPSPGADGVIVEPGLGTVGGIVSAFNSNVVFAFSELISNAARVDLGGGFGAVGGQPFLLNVEFLGLASATNEDAASFGGALGFVGSTPTVLGCVFLANKASNGSAIMGTQSTVQVHYGTFADNVASAPAGLGGGTINGVFFAQSSIFSNNVSGGLVDSGPGPDVTLDSCFNGTLVFANPTAGGDTVPYTGDDDYTLAPSSCGFDTGVLGPFSEVNRDVLGRARIVGAAPDMGAYEAPQ